MSKMIGNSAKLNKLPDRVTDINLADRLIKFKRWRNWRFGISKKKL